MLKVLCCPSPSRGRTSVYNTSADELALTNASSHSKRIDIFADERTNLQTELWDLTFQAKVRDASPKDLPIYQRLARMPNATQTMCLTYLEEYFASRKVARWMPKVKLVLEALQPFVQAVSVMVQSNPQIAALVWGTVIGVYQLLIYHANFFETVTSIMTDVAESLPRFQAFTEVLHTPRLHEVLREIYDLYIDFSVSTIKILESNTCVLFWRMQHVALSRNFNETKTKLSRRSGTFEIEAQLASAQMDDHRHREVLEKLTMFNSNETLIVGLQARNLMFVGRDDSLKVLEKNLSAPTEADSSAVRRSCTIHATGGMGKTQIALEYVYRHIKNYKYIFWIRAETSPVLTESLIDIADKLGIHGTGITVDKRLERLREKLQDLDGWLLVYDNVVHASDIDSTIPARDTGSIIITTQDSQVAFLTTSELALQSMSKHEGSELIRKHLRRGGSEQENAERLSAELGGLPLAISHFAGFVAKSQCSIEQILQSLQSRMRSSQVWSQTNLTSTRQYERTLDTVWDMALHRLTDDALNLLETMAFLEPDCMPEEMFVGPEVQDYVAVPRNWEYWDHTRFNLAICALRERNLIDRVSSVEGGYIRTHRSLQRHMLHTLDKDIHRRETIFDQALAVVRQAFPRPNNLKRGDTSLWPIMMKYIPHVNSLNINFMQSQPPLANKLEFAKLLNDGATFFHNWHARDEAITLLHTARKICIASNNEMSKELFRIQSFVEANLAMYDQWDGVQAQSVGIERTQRALKLYTTGIAGIPEDELLAEDWVALTRFNIDSAACLFAKHEMSQAEQHISDSRLTLTRAGLEKDLLVRYGLYNVYFGVMKTWHRDFKTAVGLGLKAHGLAKQGLGERHYFAAWIGFVVAMIIFASGDTPEAVRFHKEIYELRRDMHEEGHHETLSSQYQLATAYHRDGDLEMAEMLLRDILTHKMPSRTWREEDIARTEYRLSIILQQQHKPREAAVLAQSAQDRRAKWKDAIPHVDEDEATWSELHKEMLRFDLSVSFWHGRTTGRWAFDESHW